MQKIKEKIAEHKMKKEMRQDEYDNTAGATTYGETGAMGGHHHHGTQGMATGGTYAEGEVVGERPVAVGVAEVPVVVTEQERVVEETGRVGEEVCGQKTFTEVEDRPVVRERVERIVEHRPVEKQYVVETRFVGERETGVAGADIVDVKERVVDQAQPGPACPANTGAVMNEVATGMGLGHTGTHGTHGTGAYGAQTHSSDRML